MVLLRLVAVGGLAAAGFAYTLHNGEQMGKSVHAAVVSDPFRPKSDAFVHQPTVKWDWNWDKMEPESLTPPAKRTNEGEDAEKKRATASRHLFLIRHGQYHLNVDRDEDKTLTDLGKEQAELTGKRLNSLNFPYTIINYSTMPRAVHTANIISKFLPGVPMESSDLIREGAPIPPEPPISSWKPEVQQFYQDGARIEAGFRKFFHRASSDQEKDSYEVIVCHANVIRYYICRALQLTPEAWLRMSLHNGSITWVTIRPNGRVTVRAVGDAGHMPPDKLTTT